MTTGSDTLVDCAATGAVTFFSSSFFYFFLAFLRWAAVIPSAEAAGSEATGSGATGSEATGGGVALAFGGFDFTGAAFALTGCGSGAAGAGSTILAGFALGVDWATFGEAPEGVGA